MTISNDDRKSIIDEVVGIIKPMISEAVNKGKEEALLSLPEVWANLVTDHLAIAKEKEEFYKKHPKFKEHKDAVTAAIAEVDGKNPFLSLKEKLKMAVPEIRHRIKTKASLDMETINKSPDLTFKKFNPGPGLNGDI